MTFFLKERDEITFVRRLSEEKGFFTTELLEINDSLMSSRQICKISKMMNKYIESYERIYIPIQFNYKKLGDEKHRICLFIQDGIIELFDSNCWDYMIEQSGKQNLIKILSQLQMKIVTYNYSLNTVSGYCVLHTLLFLIFRSSGINVNEFYSFCETRVNVHYEKDIYTNIRRNVQDWKIYNKNITRLINEESKISKKRKRKNSPLIAF